MVEDIAGNSADGLLGDRGEDGIAHLLEDGGADARGAIGHDHATAHNGSGTAGSADIDIHGIDDALEVEGHLDIQNLGADEEGDSDGHAQLGVEVVLGPEVSRHLLHDGPISLPLLLGRLVHGGKGVLLALSILAPALIIVFLLAILTSCIARFGSRFVIRGAGKPRDSGLRAAHIPSRSASGGRAELLRLAKETLRRSEHASGTLGRVGLPGR